MTSNPRIPFDLNQVIYGIPSPDLPNQPDQRIDLHQYGVENGNEDISDDEIMHMANSESEEHNDEPGNEDFSEDESMHSGVINGKNEDAATEDESIIEVEDQDDMPTGWKYVEVAGSFDAMNAEGGGGFVIRNWEDEALLAQAFPAAGKSLLFVEAYAIHKAMDKMIALREKRVMFCIESKVLFDCIERGVPVPHDISSMLRDCINWCKRRPLFRVFLWRREVLQAADWLSKCGRRCQQHCQWDSTGPWPPGLVDLMKPRFNF